jgi:hypothetical protein
MKKFTLNIFGALLLIVGTVSLFFYSKEEPEPKIIVTAPDNSTAIEPTLLTPTSTQSVIGHSVENRNIEAYTFKTGKTNLLFVGGMHGGYEWNSILLAYEMIDYLNNNPSLIPSNVTVHIIPNINPDGLFMATSIEGKFKSSDIRDTSNLPIGTGRFNAHDVDLNRNFDCKWTGESTWRNVTVSAGTSAFSEPEAKALRDYVSEINPVAVVFWHSQANSVYASECENGILPETLTLMNTYSEASGYNAVPTFNAYPVTGDAEGWLASINIPAITVELSSHDSIDWTKNLNAMNAVLKMYGNN